MDLDLAGVHEQFVYLGEGSGGGERRALHDPIVLTIVASGCYYHRTIALLLSYSSHCRVSGHGPDYSRLALARIRSSARADFNIIVSQRPRSKLREAY
eukprot:scaffold67545_cov30-Tisochrysis_lutea.AAC.1